MKIGIELNNKLIKDLKKGLVMIKIQQKNNGM